MLEDECNLPKPSDANLVARLYASHGGHANLEQPVRPAPKGFAPRFTISHFAGSVEYDSTGLVFKNADALHPELPLLLAASATPLIAALFDE